MKEFFQAIFATVAFWVVIVLLTAGTLVFFLYIQPYVLDKERTNIQHSRQYTTTQKTKLLQLCTSYDELQTQKSLYKNNQQVMEGLNNQEKGLLIQMKQAAGLIPKEEVPECVKEKIIF